MNKLSLLNESCLFHRTAPKIPSNITALRSFGGFTHNRKTMTLIVSDDGMVMFYHENIVTNVMNIRRSSNNNCSVFAVTHSSRKNNI